jgi:hypothetical protein
MPVPPNNKFAPKPGAGGAAAKPKPTAAAAKPKPKPKKFGAATATPRDPMLPEGTVRVRHLGAEELIHPAKKTLSWRVQFTPIEGYENAGETFIALFMNTTAGVAEYQRYCVAMAGYETAGEFTEFACAVVPGADAEEAGDAFFSSVIGDANAFSEAGHTIDRRIAEVRVTFGKACIDKDTGEPTGDHFRNYKWSVVPDEEQDEAGRLEVAAE